MTGVQTCALPIYLATADRLPDYRVTCILVERAFRGQGLAATALRGAVDLIARAGGGLVEGYPHDTGGVRKKNSSFLYNGTRTMYEREGFTYDRPKGQGKPIGTGPVSRSDLQVRSPDPISRSDLPADRPFRRNLKAMQEIRAGWLEGRLDPGAAGELLVARREGSAIDTSRKVVELLNRGVAPGSVWDGLHASAGELLARQPGTLSLHASTFTNAVRYAWTRVPDDGLRRLLMLQNAAFIPLYRGQPKRTELRLNEWTADSSAPAGPEGLQSVFDDIGRNTEAGARRLLGLLARDPDPAPFARLARRLVFSKGTDAHDYKFSSAVLEDYVRISPAWRDRILAASLFNLRGSREPDTALVKRMRFALAG